MEHGTQGGVNIKVFDHNQILFVMSNDPSPNEEVNDAFLAFLDVGVGGGCLGGA
jgi:hypothetical protein